jgi:membrane fusion protein, multidrug efflux system
LAQKSATQQQFDAASANYEAAKARFEQQKRQRNSTSLVKNEQKIRLSQNEANIQLAKAALELAKLNLSYTVIMAPCDGVAGRKTIEEGQLIQPGQSLLDFVSETEKWVIANYKETQTANIHEGQTVDIKIDGIPHVTFKGFVKSISRATGASFSLFPQDNSSGNFVKVEQRIPVRIGFSAENKKEDFVKLRAGMNVECEVNY